MNRIVFLFFLCVSVLIGCVYQYVIKMSNGTKLLTVSKPKLKHGYYIFNDALGKENRVPEGCVVEIVLASMVAEDKNRFAPPKPR